MPLLSRAIDFGLLITPVLVQLLCWSSSTADPTDINPIISAQSSTTRDQLEGVEGGGVRGGGGGGGGGGPCRSHKVACYDVFHKGKARMSQIKPGQSLSLAVLNSYTER